MPDDVFWPEAVIEEVKAKVLVPTDEQMEEIRRGLHCHDCPFCDFPHKKIEFVATHLIQCHKDTGLTPSTTGKSVYCWCNSRVGRHFMFNHSIVRKSGLTDWVTHLLAKGGPGVHYLQCQLSGGKPCQ